MVFQGADLYCGLISGGVSTHLIPVLIGEFFGRVSPLDPCAVHQNLRLKPLADQCGHDAFDGLAIPKLGDMDPCFTSQAINDLVLG